MENLQGHRNAYDSPRKSEDKEGVKTFQEMGVFSHVTSNSMEKTLIIYKSFRQRKYNRYLFSH